MKELQTDGKINHFMINLFVLLEYYISDSGEMVMIVGVLRELFLEAVNVVNTVINGNTDGDSGDCNRHHV